jgi:hypothetical protein
VHERVFGDLTPVHIEDLTPLNKLDGRPDPVRWRTDPSLRSNAPGWGQVSSYTSCLLSTLRFAHLSHAGIPPHPRPFSSSMSDSLVTIAQFHGPTDATVAKRAMDSAGIESEVEDIRLEVHNEDAYRAYDVLDTTALPVIEEAYEANPDVTLCASCGSTAVTATSRIAAFAGVAAIVLGIGVAVGLTQAAFFGIAAAALFFIMTDRWRCGDCGISWN